MCLYVCVFVRLLGFDCIRVWVVVRGCEQLCVVVCVVGHGWLFAVVCDCVVVRLCVALRVLV